MFRARTQTRRLRLSGHLERMITYARVFGLAENVRETYMAISPERRLRQSSVLDIIERAREQLFQPGDPDDTDRTEL